ncbi:MAG: sigma-70 family RNA polymerase sigma factor [Phycisphaerae bacterium]|nr:sigma-70 family RNA polymerase sigma factor [Phycisphaerae bacterium]
MSASEDGLLDRAIGGDREALAQLLERYGPLVRRRLEGQIPQRWQAVLSSDDVMQETYIDAFLDVSRFEPRGEGSFTAWLMTLAKRNLLDALRMLEAEKRGKHRRALTPRTTEASLTALVEQLGCTNTTPSRQAARKEAGDCLQKAVAQLPSAYRTVVEMYDLQGRSVEEVAAALQRSPGAIFMLRARAHRQVGVLMGTASRYLSGKA